MRARRAICYAIFSCLALGSIGMPYSVGAAISSEPVYRSAADAYPRQADEFAAALVIDAQTGKALYTFQPHKKWSAASVTKLMSSLVFLDHRPSWNKIVSLSSKDEVGGGRLRVKAGARLSVQDLFYSSIVASANNTAMAMARVTGLSQKSFVSKMNAKAKALGMTESHFVEPSGMDPANLTTANDLAILAQAAFGNSAIRSAASTASYEFRIRNTGQLKTLKNTNTLLTQDPDVWVSGGKTGFLYESMYNLVVKLSPMDRSVPRHPVFVVVLGAPTLSRSFSSAKALAQWAWKAYDWPSSSQLTSATP